MQATKVTHPNDRAHHCLGRNHLDRTSIHCMIEPTPQEYFGWPFSKAMFYRLVSADKNKQVPFLPHNNSWKEGVLAKCCYKKWLHHSKSTFLVSSHANVTRYVLRTFNYIWLFDFQISIAFLNKILFHVPALLHWQGKANSSKRRDLLLWMQ